MNADDFLALATTNHFTSEIATRLPALELHDAWLVSGCLFQPVWNALTKRAPTYGVRDYDVFYFDRDCSREAEERVGERATRLFADLGVHLELRNQARVHHWYEADFGTPYPPLGSSCEGIDRFLVRASMVGARCIAGAWEVYAPCGFDDVAQMIVRPNRAPNFSATHYAAKARRWSACWPELSVIEP